MVVDTEVGQVVSEKITQLPHPYELLEEIHAAEVRQTSMITSEIEVSRRSAHAELLSTEMVVKARSQNLGKSAPDMASGHHPSTRLRRI